MPSSTPSANITCSHFQGQLTSLTSQEIESLVLASYLGYPESSLSALKYKSDSLKKLLKHSATCCNRSGSLCRSKLNTTACDFGVSELRTHTQLRGGTMDN